ncbi:MAG TPA: type 1 glutamine amidotransferase domain-containing protein [Actinomycetota bacterium]|nr:type 1 glutamine amidotransferase domain-containing protein [Actinomycetota bacterium]
MANELQGKRVAFLATDGVEQVELTEPWQAVMDAGATVELLSPKPDAIQAMNGMEKGAAFEVDRAVADARPDEYDGLILPGGVKNPDLLRMDEASVSFVREFVGSGRPVAVICHGPWTLVEAGVVRGRTLTSYPSVRTDIENAGGTWVDEEVHVDNGLVSSRKPADLPAFCRKLVEEIAEGHHEPAQAGAGAQYA